MKPFRTALAMASLLAAIVAMNTPAQALKALQYKAQGHGRYLNSNGTPQRYSHGRGFFGHRHYRRHRGY